MSTANFSGNSEYEGKRSETNVPAKDKYAFVVALLASVLAFSAFKEGLKGAHISIGFWIPDLLVLSIWFSVFLMLAAYCFALSYMVTSAKPVTNVWTRLSVGLGNAFYITGISAPIVLAALWGLTEAVKVVVPVVDALLDTELKVSSRVVTLLSGFSGLLAAIVGVWSGYSFARFKDRASLSTELGELSLLRDRQLERAEGLYRQKFYTSAILESYKLLELAIRQALVKKGYYYAQYKPMNELIRGLIKEGLFTQDQINLLNDVRALRNKASHSIIDFDKKDADRVIGVTQDLLQSLDSNTGGKSKSGHKISDKEKSTK